MTGIPAPFPANASTTGGDPHGPPGWMSPALSTVPDQLTRMYGRPDWEPSGCALTAVLLADRPRGAWLARLTPAPFCIDADFHRQPVRPLFNNLVAARKPALPCWAALVVYRRANGTEECDVSWLWALMEATEEHQLPALDVLIREPSGPRHLCGNTLRRSVNPAASTAPVAPGRIPVHHAVEIDPETALRGYERDRHGRWNLPRSCTIA